MNDIYRILEKLDSITESPSKDNKVKQLPALFKPKSASPALTGKYPTRNATRGYMVGEETEDKMGLAEAMTEIEEDMLSKVKKDLTQYLDKLEKKMQVNNELTDKAVDAVEKGQVEQDQDADYHTPLAAVESAPVKTVSMSDGRIVEIHGNVQEGFQIRHRDRSMASRFGTLEEAEMAIKLFQSRQSQPAPDADYLDEA